MKTRGAVSMHPGSSALFHQIIDGELLISGVAMGVVLNPEVEQPTVLGVNPNALLDNIGGEDFLHTRLDIINFHLDSTSFLEEDASCFLPDPGVQYFSSEACS